MNKQSKNDIAWQRVFEQKPLLPCIGKDGYVYISADELRTFGRREPRLMAKQDTLSARPAIFKEQNLTIFPVENGRYIIFRDQKHKSYFLLHSILEDIPNDIYHPTCELNSFDTYPENQQFSESQAIDFAFVSSLLQTFFDDSPLYLTLRGRLRSGEFSFTLPNKNYQAKISGVQIEIDAGYESLECIYLIEAKVGKRDDFHIRQLFYPYLEWSQKSGKEIVPVLLLYSNSQYYVLQFQLSRRFGEMTVVKKACYTINESPRTDIDFTKLFQDIPMETEPSVPYPQADDLDKVMDLIHIIANGIDTKAGITEHFEFDERQSDYYANAGIYLGFIERSNHTFVLTRSGRQFSRSQSRKERTRLLMIQLVKRPTFRDVLHLLFDADKKPRLFEHYISVEDVRPSEIARIIQTFTPLNEKTAYRRASTVRSWMKWVLRNCDYTSMIY